MSDLLSALNFKETILSGKFLFITKDERSDLGFVFIDVLGCLVKMNFTILVFNLAQSFNHYHQLLSKVGVNLKTLKENGRAFVVDILNCTEQFIGNSLVENNPVQIFPLHNTEIDVKRLYAAVKNGVARLRSLESEGFIIFIDEINVLRNLGVPWKDILNLLHYCKVLCVEQCGVLIIGGELEAYDLESFHVFTFLSHLANTIINVQGLSTGCSKDIHGKLWCKVKKEDDRNSKETRVLFRVEEKGAKFLSLGV